MSFVFGLNLDFKPKTRCIFFERKTHQENRMNKLFMRFFVVYLSNYSFAPRFKRSLPCWPSRPRQGPPFWNTGRHLGTGSRTRFFKGIEFFMRAQYGFGLFHTRDSLQNLFKIGFQLDFQPADFADWQTEGQSPIVGLIGVPICFSSLHWGGAPSSPQYSSTERILPSWSWINETT